MVRRLFRSRVNSSCRDVPLNPKQREGLNKETVTRTPLEKHDHECIENHDQRPHLRNDRGRSHRDPRRTRWKDVLLLQRTLPAKVSVHSRRCPIEREARMLLWITTRSAKEYLRPCRSRYSRLVDGNRRAGDCPAVRRGQQDVEEIVVSSRPACEMNFYA